jgi:hypothetical protein
MSKDKKENIDKKVSALLEQNKKLRNQLDIQSEKHSKLIEIESNKHKTEISVIKKAIKQKDIDIQEEKAFNNRPAGSRVLLCRDGFGIIENAIITGDHKLIYSLNGQKEEVEILFQPITTIFSIRDYWHMGGFIGRFKLFMCSIFLKLFGMAHFGNLKFDLYGVRIGGETTFDLSQDKTPDQIKRIFENMAKIDKEVKKGKWAAMLWDGLSDDINRLFKIVVAFLIAQLLVIFMFLIAFGDAIGAK